MVYYSLFLAWDISEAERSELSDKVKINAGHTFQKEGDAATIAAFNVDHYFDTSFAVKVDRDIARHICIPDQEVKGKHFLYCGLMEDVAGEAFEKIKKDLGKKLVIFVEGQLLRLYETHRIGKFNIGRKLNDGF